MASSSKRREKDKVGRMNKTFYTLLRIILLVSSGTLKSKLLHFPLDVHLERRKN